MSPKTISFIYPECATKTFGSNEGNGRKSEKTISPPLGILYLATELIEAGYTVEAYDFNAEKYSDEKCALIVKGSDCIGISLLSFNREQAEMIIARITKLNPTLPIIVGGADCILHPRYIEGTELTVCSEAESTIVRIVNAIFSGISYETLPGVFFKNAKGEIKEGGPYQYETNLDTIKFPQRNLLRRNKGYSVIGKRASENVTTIITSRGCPKKCSFCAHGAIAYQKYRQRSAENVLEELQEIADAGYRIVGIVDDNFTADKKRARIILEGIVNRKLKLAFAVQSRVDAADPELFRLMKKAGVRGITYGLESGNQQTLDFFNKQTTVEQNRFAVVEADRAGLYTAGLFIIGAPRENKDDFQRTYHFAASLPLDVTSFWVLDYTYGSTLWAQAYKKGKIKSHEFNVPAGKERGTSPYPTEELELIAEKMFFRFYTRPIYWLRQAVKIIRVRDRYFVNVLCIGLYWLMVKKVEMTVQRVASFFSPKEKRGKTQAIDVTVSSCEA